MEMIIKQIKPNYPQQAKYSKEEIQKLFAEGHIRSMSKVKKSKKTYSRKQKYRNKDY